MRIHRRSIAAAVVALTLGLAAPATAQSPDDVLDGALGAVGEIGGVVRTLPGGLARGLTGPFEPVIAAAAGGACDPIDPLRCLLPFPNDRFTTTDPSTGTGRRIALHAAATPRNVLGLPLVPSEWNRNDGFSPGSMLLTAVPDLDLPASFGLPDGIEAQVQLPSSSLAADAPIVLLDAHTGQRHPYWAELDTHPDTTDDGRLLIIRPLQGLEPGHRYVVALRGLRTRSGAPIAAGPAFAALRDGLPATACAPSWPEPRTGASTTSRSDTSTDAADEVAAASVRDDQGNRAARIERRGRGAWGGVPAEPDAPQQPDEPEQPDEPAQPEPPVPPAPPEPCDADLPGEEGRYQRLFGELTAAGVDTDELFLAWDFTVASSQNLTGRSLAMRDQAFAALGDHDLADGRVDGAAPAYRITAVEQRDDDLTVRGTLTAPNFLTLPQDLPRLPPEQLDTGVEQYLPGSRLHYGTLRPGPNAVPQVNPLAPTVEARFVCHLPNQATADDPALPTLYGHGLLGSESEAGGGSTRLLRGSNHLVCATPWIGMATEDVLNVVTLLTDTSLFPSLPDRSQQGFVHFHLLGRLMIHPDGLAADPAFQDEAGHPRIDTREVVYDGNSQGGILGGAMIATSPDVRKAALGVPGGNYSTLLNRSVDWEGAYGEVLYATYPDKVDQQLVLALIQMLWDRSETNGYRHALTDRPLPRTPSHRVLFQLAYADHQVANIAAEVDARTSGARFLQTSLAPGRHWADLAGQRTFRFAPFDVDARTGRPLPHEGSALVYVDSGNDPAPLGNTPPRDQTDPHGDPRADPHAHEQKTGFLRSGVVHDTRAGQPYWSSRCRGPAHPAGC